VPHLGLIQLIGKWLFLAGLYVFIFAIFRALFRSLKLEDAEERLLPGQRRGGQVARDSAMRPAAREESVGQRAAVPERTAHAAAEQVVAQQPARAVDVPSAQPVAGEPVSRPDARRSKPCFVVVAPGSSGLSAGTVFPLTAAVTIGRSAENSIRVSDRFASTRHAMVFLKDGRRILRDRGSTNGTTRNGKKIASEVALCNGDLVGIGTVVLEYRSHS